MVERHPTKMLHLLVYSVAVLMSLTSAQSTVNRVSLSTLGFRSNADLKQCKIDIGDFAIAMACNPGYDVYDADIFLKLPLSKPTNLATELYVADLRAVLEDGRSKPYYAYVDRDSDVTYRDVL